MKHKITTLSQVFQCVCEFCTIVPTTIAFLRFLQRLSEQFFSYLLTCPPGSCAKRFDVVTRHVFHVIVVGICVPQNPPLNTRSSGATNFISSHTTCRAHFPDDVNHALVPKTAPGTGALFVPISFSTFYRK